ncbi:hypothetical protein MRX96_018714 [Rhipicephalus microplus]
MASLRIRCLCMSQISVERAHWTTSATVIIQERSLQITGTLMIQGPICCSITNAARQGYSLGRLCQGNAYSRQRGKWVHCVKRVLQNEPKFCEHPNLDKVELLDLVRSIVGRGKDDEIGRLVQEGVECLPQDVKTARQRSSAVVASLRRAEVKLLQSDKGGGLVLMPKHLYDSKAEEAMRKNFKRSLAVLPIYDHCLIKSPVTVSDYLRTECPKRRYIYITENNVICLRHIALAKDGSKATAAWHDY